MKIYVVIYSYNNGLSYEDYDHWDMYKLFSDYNKASQYYWEKVSEDYEGQYTLLSWELDTQEQEEIEKSEYVPCTPDTYDYDSDAIDWDQYEEDLDDFYDYTVGAKRDPASSLDAAWEYIERCEEYDNYMRDQNSEEYEEFILGKEALEWLNTPHAINMDSKRLEYKRTLAEADKLLTNVLLDSYAKEFCEKYNKCKGAPFTVSILIARYRKKCEKLGYANAWIAYLKELEVI